MDSTFTHLAAMRYTPAIDGRRRRAADERANLRALSHAKGYHDEADRPRPRNLPIYAR
jgi:hypothetical protein